MATLAAAVGAFYIEYEDAPRGYRHLRLELRALVCRVSGAEVVEGSGGVAIAFLCYWGPRPHKMRHLHLKCHKLYPHLERMQAFKLYLDAKCN